MRIIGLDISTSTIGRCVIDFNSKGKAKLIYIDYYKPIKNTIENKDMDFLFTLSEAKKEINSLIEKYKPDYVAVEDFIRFMKGSSGAGTVIPLALLNRTICLSVKENFPDVALTIHNVMSIRTHIKKQIGREDLPSKQEIPEIIEKLLNITIPSPIKKTRNGEKIMVEREDMADAIAVAYHCYHLINKASIKIK